MVTFQPAIQITKGSAGTDPQIVSTTYAPAEATATGQIVLFLSGAAHKQTYWQQLAECLAQWGQRSLTLDYRAQGESTWSEPVQQTTLLQKVADVEAVIEGLGLDPRQVILVGHSMGGGVAQMYAARHEVAGLMLLASLALGHWTREFLLRLPGQMLRHPRVFPHLGKDTSTLFATPHLAREYLFDTQTPEAVVQQYLNDCWCHESGQAMMQLTTAKAQRLQTGRLFFIAGRRDASVHSVRQSAMKMGAPLLEVEMPHDLMLAPGWEEVAYAIWAFTRGGVA